MGGAPLVFVDDLAAPELADADRHHLQRVLRVRPGSAIVVSDGAGRWRDARFGDTVVATGEIEVAPRPAPAVTVAFALPKGDRPELIVQKLTELGVDRMVPMTTERSVVRWDGKGTRHLDRLRVVARGAAMQSRRCWLPAVDAVVPFEEAAAARDAALADAAGAPVSLATPTVLIGPEGGWSERERACGLPLVSLGDATLRIETAAIAAAVLLTALRAGNVREVG